MSGPIQIFPPGLLGFLQIKNQGANPDNLGPVVAPTLELRNWYFQARMLDGLNLFGGNGQVLVPTAGAGLYTFTTNPFTVPQNAWLYVDHFSIFAALLAAETIRFAPVLITFPGIAGQSQLQVGADVNDVVTARARKISAFGGGFFCPPNSQLGFQCFDSLTAGNITVFGSIKAALLPN